MFTASTQSSVIVSTLLDADPEGSQAETTRTIIQCGEGLAVRRHAGMMDETHSMD